jgi:hypothetical protein
MLKHAIHELTSHRELKHLRAFNIYAQFVPQTEHKHRAVAAHTKLAADMLY